MKMGITVDAKVIRGPVSWAYFYVFLGFVLSIEGTIIAMWQRLEFPWNELVYVAVGGMTFYFVLFNAWFKNKLVGWKSWYENRAQ